MTTTSDATSADNTSYATPSTSPATQQYANGLIDYLGELKRETDLTILIMQMMMKLKKNVCIATTL